MGAFKEHHLITVTHRWRARARNAESREEEVYAYLRAARIEGLSEHGRLLLIGRAIGIIERGGKP